MRRESKKIEIFGQQVTVVIQIFEQNDKMHLRKIWETWKELKDMLQQYEGRSPNLPEIVSEGAWCLYSGSVRLLNTSADTYNLETQEAEQIKACSTHKELTSFGPRAKWDKLYFLDFYRDGGNLDGSFDIYEIPDSAIFNKVLNEKRNETFKNQQEQGRRPRLSLRELVKELNINPIDKDVKIF